MSDAPRAASALDGIAAAAGAAVTMHEQTRPGMLLLRGQPEERAFLDAVEHVLGFALPSTPNTTTGTDPLFALWSAPDEWLLLTPPDAQHKLEQALNNAFGDLFAGVTDISSGYTVLELGGPQVRELLVRGCPMDLHPREFGPGRCARTLLAKAGVLLFLKNDDPVFLVAVRRSFADYLWRWLSDAVRDLGSRTRA